MPKIKIAKTGVLIEARPGQTLMQSVLAAGLPVASSCNGDGVCAKCQIQIVVGAENLSPPNPIEVFLCEKNKIPSNKRISCQTEVLGDITVDTTYW
jgi:2Fe-2S ferredoxin